MPHGVAKHHFLFAFLVSGVWVAPNTLASIQLSPVLASGNAGRTASGDCTG